MICKTKYDWQSYLKIMKKRGYRVKFEGEFTIQRSGERELLCISNVVLKKSTRNTG